MTDIHHEIDNWIAGSLGGGLSDGERKTFENHLLDCPSCRALFKEGQMLNSMVEKAFAPERPAKDFENQMVRKFRSDLTKQGFDFSTILRKFTQPFRISGIGWAVVLVLLVLAVGFLNPALHRARESARRENVTSNGSQVSLAVKQSPVVLDDSSSFRDEDGLTANASVPQAFHGPASHKPLEQRITELDGRLKEMSKSGPVAGIGIKLNGYSDTSYLAALGDTSSKANTVSIAGSRVVSFPPAESPPNKSPSDSPIGSSEVLEAADQKAEGIRKQELAANRPPKTQSAGEETDLLSNDGPNMRKTQERSPPPSLPETPAPTTKLIRNATLQFEVQNFESSIEVIMKIVKEENGFVATTNSSRLPNGKVSGQVIVKVLPDRLERLVLKFRGLGDLKDEHLAADDVTNAYFDTEARMRNAKRMEDRLLKMLDEAKGKVTDLLVVEKELARVRETIEQMQGQLKLWDALVQFATITINLSEKDMNQPAAFLLKEKAILSIFSPHVEKTFQDAKHEVELAKGQILHSNLNRDNEGRVSAVLSVLVDAEQSTELIGRLKTMGRVNTLTWQNERVAQGGTGVSDTARVQKDKVEVNLAIVHDDESRKQVNLVVVSKGVEEALEKAKAAAVAGVEILSSNLEQTPDGRATAHFSARVPAKVCQAFLTAIKALGRVSEFTIQRDDKSVANKEAEDAPVLLSLTLTDQEAPRQQSGLTVEAKDVEGKVTGIKESAPRFGAEVLNSTFERSPDGRELANFTFRLPMSKHAPFVDYLKGLGKVKDFSVKRQDRPKEGKMAEEAPAEVTLLLYSQGNIVTDDTGLFSILRKSTMQGLETLMWSVKLIFGALGFLAPWALVIGLVAGVGALIRRRRKT